MSHQIRERDTLARLGGDEFGILLNNYSVEKAKDIGNNIISALSKFRFTWDDQVFTVGVSIGIVNVSNDLTDHGKITERADAACYAAKKQGRNQIYIYADKETSEKHN